MKYNIRGRSCLIDSGTLSFKGFFQKWAITTERTLDGKTVSVTKGIIEIEETGKVILVEPETITYTDFTNEH